MPKVTVYDMTGKEMGTRDLAEAVFGIEPPAAEDALPEADVPDRLLSTCLTMAST